MSAKWYIVQAYSNFEHRVKESLERDAAAKGLDHLFEEILVPTEEIVEVRKGRKVESKRKFFPGYVLVKVDLTDEAYHLVKESDGFPWVSKQADASLRKRSRADCWSNSRGC